MNQEHTTPFRHQPVLAARVVELLTPVPDGVIVDCTVGAGGHAAALLAADDRRHLIGIDRDPDALAAAAAALGAFSDRVMLRHASYHSFDRVLEGVGRPPVAGVLFDLGVSSPQFDQPDRGFSYRYDGPLDMRMDPTAAGPTAADVVNTYDKARLARLFSESGEARYARRIAAAVVAARPLHTTLALADVVRAALPAPARRTRGHPARRVFQALRIEVNGELDALAPAIDAAIAALVPGGRCAVLAYHSGEDRIVKDRFLHAETGGCTCPPQLPCGCGAVRLVRLLGRGARRPSPEEVARNPRAESARLRACEKLAETEERA
jgi:16S rRNA (cytosine1402-N4)-methyltransferase